MDKVIKISAKMDTAEFDRAIDAMQRKMRQISTAPEAAQGFITAKDRLATAGVGTGATEADRQRAARMEREAQERAIRFAKEQTAIAERANKLYDQREARIKQINEEITKGAKNELELRQKITQLEEQKAQAAQRSLSATKAANEALTRFPGAPPGGGGGGPGFGGGFMGGAGGGGAPFGLQNIMRLAGVSIPGMIGAAGTGLSIAANINTSLAAAQRVANVAQGNAMQGFVGDQISNIFAGNNIENILFARQRGTASASAKAEEQRRRTSDILGIGGGVLGRVGAGAGVGAGIGGIIGGGIGMMIPLPGATMAGAALGAKYGGIIGGTMGAGAAGLNIATDPLKRSALFDEQAYEQLSSQRQAAMYQEQFQAEMMKNPIYREGARAFQARAPQELQLQRAMGMTDEQVRQLSESGTFTRQQMIEASAGILGAGGSTRAAKGSGFFANMMERQYDLTNAPQLLGRLSGAMGGAGESQSALMKMLSESFKIGLDSSDFREENRKFLGITSEMVYRAGAGPQGAGAIAGMFGAYVGERTGRGLEAAQTAMQAASAMATETGGARGALGAQAALREGFGKLSVPLQNAIQTITPQELESEASAPLISAIADDMGISTEEVKKKIRKVQDYKQTASGTSEKEREKLRSMTKTGVFSIETLKKQQARFGAATGYESGLKGVMEQQAYAAGQAELGGGGPMVRGAGGIPEGVGISPERAADKMNEAIAAQDKAASAQIRLIADTLKSSLGTSAEEVGKFTEALIEATRVLKEANTPEQKKSARQKLEDIQSKFSSFMPEEETKAGGR